MPPNSLRVRLPCPVAIRCAYHPEVPASQSSYLSVAPSPPASSGHNPNGSLNPAGLFPAYAFRLTPPASPMGSLVSKDHGDPSHRQALLTPCRFLSLTAAFLQDAALARFAWVAACSYRRIHFVSWGVRHARKVS